MNGVCFVAMVLVSWGFIDQKLFLHFTGSSVCVAVLSAIIFSLESLGKNMQNICSWTCCSPWPLELLFRFTSLILIWYLSPITAWRVEYSLSNRSGHHWWLQPLSVSACLQEPGCQRYCIFFAGQHLHVLYINTNFICSGSSRKWCNPASSPCL